MGRILSEHTQVYCKGFGDSFPGFQAVLVWISSRCGSDESSASSIFKIEAALREHQKN